MLWRGGAFIGAAVALIHLARRSALSSVTLICVLLWIVGLLVGSRLQFSAEVGTLPGLSEGVAAFRFNAGGNRISLGIALGFVISITIAFVFGARWKDVGDAEALGMAATIAIGRWGCWLNGCCIGGVCPTWMGDWCPRFPQGTEAYRWQAMAGMFAPGTELSLPAHPLPLYFSAAAAGLFLLLLYLDRRRVPSGTLLLVFCLVRPATKLSLEPLRAARPDGPDGLMFWIPAIALAGSLCCAVWLLVGRRVGTRDD